MRTIINWIKSHKLVCVLLIFIGYQYFQQIIPIMPSNYSRGMGSVATSKSVGMATMDYNMPLRESAPAPDVTNRLVVTNSYLSLLVTNVTQVQKQILDQAEKLGGYMVNTDLQNPSEAPTSTVTIRIPANKLNIALTEFKKLSIKVVSESLSGEDVTDQYVDNDARLLTLNRTKVKFEQILESATEIADILNVQREIINLQSQIDAIKGSQNYLEKNAQMAKLTVYLSTDELALPYAPTETWRPQVIFKQAVRSLIGNIRKLGSVLIWLLVYSIIWLPILIIIYIIKRGKTRSKT